MKKKLFATLSCICFAAILLAQNPPQVIPPSPTAYALGKYGDLPVSLYTGVPSVSIPIFNLKNKDVEVPVSLSYHGGGNKVDEMASFVGLAWVLNAGGAITRTVHGQPEYLSNTNELRPERADVPLFNPSVNHDIEDFVSTYGLQMIADGGLDSEPDEFFYNFAGHSGKFYFGKDGHVVMNKNEPLDIQWKYDAVLQYEVFTIKDEKGVTYEFKQTESTYYGSNYGSKTSAWYVTKIKSPTGNEITFEYYGPAGSQQIVRSYIANWVYILPYNSTITPSLNVAYYGTDYAETRLHKIISTNGRLEFNYKSQARLDYNSISGANNALEEIVYYKPDNTVFQRFKLFTSYFEANNIRKYDGANPTNFQSLNYRLRLDSVQFFSAGNQAMQPPYKLSYLGDDDPNTDDPYTLPYRISPQQDHWGFYNKSSNTHMIPGKPQDVYIAYDEWYYTFMLDISGSSGKSIDGGANREVDTAAMKANMLKRVTYPTGGYTELDFEANDYAGNLGGLRIRKITDYPVAGAPKETIYTYDGGYSNYNPKDYYFEYYKVHYFQGVPDHRAEVPLAFGVPVSPNTGQTMDEEYFKITVQPQAILGPGSQIGYSIVTETSPGNGYTVSAFAGNSQFPDYFNRDLFSEGTPAEVDMVNNNYISEYLAAPNAGAPDGNYVRKSSNYYGDWPYPELASNEWKRGVLTDKTIYREDNTPVKSEHFEYYRKIQDTVCGLKLIRISPIEYLYSRYYFPGTWSAIKSHTVYDYNMQGTNPVTTQQDYFYDNMAHMQPTRIETTNSKGEKEVSVMTYPKDYASGTTFIENMKDSHLVVYPIEQVKYTEKSGSQYITGGNITTYKTGGRGLMDQQWRLETTAPVALANFKFSNRAGGVLPPAGSATSFSADNKFKLALTFNNYDPKGNLKEFTKADNAPVSFLWDYDLQYPVAQVTAADSDQIAHTSFESNGNGSLYIQQPGNIQSGDGITGNKCYAIDGVLARFNLTPAKTYIVSLWTKDGIPDYNGYNGATLVVPSANSWTTGRTVAGWTYREKKISGVTTINIGGGGGLVDEVRIYPAEAQMSTFTYNPLIGMTSQCDANNRITYYEYDIFSRLSLVRDQDRNILKKICYNYAGQPEGCDFFSNVAQSGNFTRNNCGTGSIGSTVTYTVAAGVYSSTISQADADQKAQDDVNANGQNYANTNGTCIPLDVSIYGENNSGATITLQFHNNTSGLDYWLTADPHNAGTLGDVPPGNYNITITSSNPSGYFYYSVGCGLYNDGIGALTFYGVDISSGCNSITID